MARAQTKADNFEEYTLDELRKALKAERAYDDNRISRNTVQQVASHVTNFFVTSIDPLGSEPEKMDFVRCIRGVRDIMEMHERRVKMRKNRIKTMKKLIRAKRERK